MHVFGSRKTLLRESKDNEAEVFGIFQLELSKWVEPSDKKREEILFCVGVECIKFKK